jgi:hypothetical protein
MSQPVLVGVRFIVIPDGVIEEKNKPRRLRISLAASPHPHGETTIDLRRWPEELAKLSKSLRLIAGNIVDAPGNIDRRDIVATRVISGAVADIGDAYVERAQMLWSRIFSGASDPVQALADVVKEGHAGPPPTNVSKVVGFQTAQIAKAMDTLTRSAVAATLAERLRRQINPFSTVDQRPAFDATTPGGAWWLSQYASWMGRSSLDPNDRLASRRRLPFETFPRPRDDIAIRVADHQTRLGDLFCKAEPSHAPVGPLVEARNRVTAAEHLVDRVFDTDFWRGEDLDTPSMLADQQQACVDLAEEMHRLDQTLQACGVQTLNAALDADTPREIAGRKFVAILSHPSLAKYLRLVIDLEIDEAAFASAAPAGQGALAVDIPRPAMPKGEEVVWTHYIRAPDYFGPAARNEGAQDAWLERGLVRLQAKTGAQSNRFELVADDAVRTAAACMRKAEDIAAAKLEGQPLAEGKSLPRREAMGIALIDNDRVAFDKARKDRSDLIDAISTFNIGKPTDQQQPHIRDAEDLLQGYRIDVATLPPGAGPKFPTVGRWRGLCGRDVKYHRDVDAGDPTIDRDVAKGFMELASVIAVSARDDGMVSPITGEHPQANGACIIEPFDALMIWQGDGLGVPGQAEPDLSGLKPGDPIPPPVGAETTLDASQTLAIDMMVDLPRDPLRLIPPFRASCGYLLGARMVFNHGCGPILAAAAPRYDDVNSRLRLGDGDKPYVLRRHEPIRGPEVLLAWNDKRLVGSASMPPGESIHDLVVRDAGATTPRFLAPPQAPFTVSEQHGVFDRDPDDIPRGALVGPELTAVREEMTGEFPLARSDGWSFRLPGQTPNPSNTATESRGSVLVLRDRKPTPGEPPLRSHYYPDPLARRLQARLLADDKAENVFDGLDNPIEFWAFAAPPRAAKVIHVELAGIPAPPPSKRTKRGRLRAGQKVISVEPTGRQVKVPQLTIELPPGETASLQLWCDTDADRILAEHAVAHGALATLGKARASSADGALSQALAKLSAGSVLTASQQAGPLGLLQDSVSIRVTHAVKRPLEAPYFNYASSPEPSAPGRMIKTPTLKAVCLTIGTQSGVDGYPSWEKFVTDQGAKPELTWESREGGATTFLVGSLVVDRLTTGAVRCEANWQEHGAERYQKDDDGRWTYQFGKSAATLFSLPAEAVERPTNKPVDLTRGPDGKALRALAYSFVDGKARRLELALVATSRFTNDFPSAVPADFEHRSETQANLACEIWTPCTFRPPPPEVERVLPIFRWRRKHHNSGKIVHTREGGLRIYLKRNWFASGEGELLGLVLPPATITDVCQLDGLGRFGEYLTRWGSDPIHDSGRSDGLVRIEDFIPPGSKFEDALEGPVYQNTLTLHLAKPLPGAASDTDGPTMLRDVRVLGYRPQAGEEGHYCDIYINPRDGYFPFVQLGLTRLQPHAVEKLELSNPVAQFAQAPPSRTITVQFSGNSNFTVYVDGVGYNDAGSGVPDTRATPMLNLRVLEVVAGDQVEDGLDGAHIRWKPLQPGGKTEKFHQPPKPGKAGLLRWEVPMQLPTIRRDQFGDGTWRRRYALLIEEVEVMLERDTGNLVERGPFMSRIVDLAPWTASSDDETWG